MNSPAPVNPITPEQMGSPMQRTIGCVRVGHKAQPTSIVQ